MSRWNPLTDATMHETMDSTSATIKFSNDRYDPFFWIHLPSLQLFEQSKCLALATAS